MASSKFPFVLMMTKKETRNYTLKLDRLEFHKLFNLAGIAVPANATITIEIPRGGDYSGMTLDVDKSNPVVIKWKEEVHVA